MEKKSNFIHMNKHIKVLIADDSILFRRALIQALMISGNVEIVGEASNGVEALDLALKLRPDLLIMDMEMPMMDGLTALMHLMSFQPTPTVIFSSLSAEGSIRSFDALKKGAVDFIGKNTLGNYSDGSAIEQKVVERIIKASQVEPHSSDSMFSSKEMIPATPAPKNDIIFCEECGTRNIIDQKQKRLMKELRCIACGDLLEENLINKYRRLNYVSVLGTGDGGYSNLLKIIPNLSEELNGAVVIILKEKKKHVNTFTDYVASISKIKVVRATNDQTMEGGTCYIAAASEKFCMKPYSAHFTLTQAKKLPKNSGPFDLFMSSAAPMLKDRLIGIIASGKGYDGQKGINCIKENGGNIAVLKGANCLYKELSEHILKTCNIKKSIDEREAADLITQLHWNTNSECTAA